MEIAALGWNDAFDEQFGTHAAAGGLAARVVSEHRDIYRVLCEHGEISAAVSGRFRHETTARTDFPTVGDWVSLRLAEDGTAIIETVLPRRSVVSRRFGDEEQLIAVNIDTLFLVCGLDGNFNVRRLERYVTMAWDSGADPVILLNKADVCDDVEERLAQVEAIAIGVPVVVLSAVEGRASTRSRPGSSAAPRWPWWAHPASASRRSSTASWAASTWPLPKCAPTTAWAGIRLRTDSS